jgi:hypothetical protein
MSPPGGSRKASDISITDKIIAAATVVATIIALLALRVSFQTENRVQQDGTQQNASKVYLGEAPKYAYTYAYQNHLVSKPDEIVWVVMNASDVQIGNVWVEGENGKWDFINNVQGCSLYALPYGFGQPVAIDFSDSYGQWRRAVGAGPEMSNFNAPSRTKLWQRGKLWGSPWWLDVPYCGLDADQALGLHPMSAVDRIADQRASGAVILEADHHH